MHWLHQRSGSDYPLQTAFAPSCGLAICSSGVNFDCSLFLFLFLSSTSLLMLHSTLIRSKLQYASVVWNSVTSTNTSKLECIQHKFFISLSLSLFQSLTMKLYKCPNYLKFLTSKPLEVSHQHAFLLKIYNSSEYFPALLETVGLHWPTWDLRDFTLFNVDLKCCNCPSARCTSADNAIHKDTGMLNRSILMNDMLDIDIFPKYIETLQQILHWVQPLTFYVTDGFKLVRLFVLNLTIFCTIFATVLCNQFSNTVKILILVLKML